VAKTNIARDSIETRVIERKISRIPFDKCHIGQPSSRSLKHSRRKIQRCNGCTSVLQRGGNISVAATEIQNLPSGLGNHLGDYWRNQLIGHGRKQFYIRVGPIVFRPAATLCICEGFKSHRSTSSIAEVFADSIAQNLLADRAR